MSRQIARNPVDNYYLDLAAGSNVTTSAWTQLTASTLKPFSAFQIFNGSGSVLMIAIGAAASEVAIPYYIMPGQTSPLMPYDVSKGSRLSLKAKDADATDGSFVMNVFG